MMDPRRLGQHNSGLSDEDLTDVFCILHPASLSAYRATALISEDAPHHTLSAGGINVKDYHDTPGISNESELEPGTFELAEQGLLSRDIALRLSAKCKNPLLGFCFGRNLQRNDFVIGREDTTRKISNIHFRIYINEHGIIMLEDQSTNGTVVEDTILRGKNRDKGFKYRHTLEQGTLIKLVMANTEEDMKFVVRIPQREGYFEDQFDENLQSYLLRLKQLREAREAEIALKAKTGDKAAEVTDIAGPASRFYDCTLSSRLTMFQPDLFGQVPLDRTPSASTSDSRRHIKEWRGGPKYKKLDKIGKGAFAVVYTIASRFDGTIFAAKELEKRRFMKNGVLDQKVENEMIIMSKIKHVRNSLFPNDSLCLLPISRTLSNTSIILIGTSISISSWTSFREAILVNL
jgi:hypothetical protein